jgi:signal transduction histidine kinase
MRAVPSLLNHFGRMLPSKQIDGELIGIERILAIARFGLAFTALLALYFDSARPFRYNYLVYGLLFLYLAHAFALLIVLQLRKQVPAPAVWAIHGADVLWPGAISFLTNGPSSPFFLFFTFALLAAAFRWGMYQVLLTTVAGVTTVAVETILLRQALLVRWLGADFDIKSGIIRSAYLTIFALLLGYVSELEKTRRAQALVIAQISARARVDAGLKRTLQSIFEQILQAFGAREVLLIASEPGAYPANLWSMEVRPGMPEPLFTVRKLESSGEQKYIFGLPKECAAVAWRGSTLSSAICVRKDSSRLHGASCRLHPNFITQHRFATLLLCTVSPAPDISARIFLVEPKLGGHPEAQLRFFQELTNHVTPAVYNVYLLRHLRSRAAAVERARMARDLHDGLIQSLHAVAFRLYALRTSNVGGEERSRELLEVQELVQKEAANLRMLLQQLKPIDVDPRHVVDFLSRMIDRFRYDTGIAAHFKCDVPDLSLTPSICREVARIVQEALANVLKHSGAENVVVRLRSHQGRCTLTIEDDGRGFEFAGRFDHVTLENSRRGPFVIKERVRAINGQISIESRPGQGARLEITFSQVSPSSIS